MSDERWVAPLPDDKKPTIKVAPCLGCGRLPHPDEVGCLRRRIVQLTTLQGRTIEQRAEDAYTAYAEEAFGTSAGPARPRGKETGRFWQTRPVEWNKLQEFFKEKWRRIVRTVV